MSRNLYKCELDFSGYRQDVAARSEHGARDVIEKNANERKENNLRGLLRDIHTHVECEEVEDGDLDRAQNYSEYDDEWYDHDLGW